MHDDDLELLEAVTREDGKRRFRVAIKAASLERWYLYHPEQDAVTLDDDPIKVGGHDMSSIIGKRVREWLRTTVLK